LRSTNDHSAAVIASRGLDRRRDQGDRLGRTDGVPIGADDDGALGREQQRSRAALATGGPGDQDHLAGQSVAHRAANVSATQSAM
jgi:hypothetical protein